MKQELNISIGKDIHVNKLASNGQCLKTVQMVCVLKPYKLQIF